MKKAARYLPPIRRAPRPVRIALTALLWLVGLTFVLPLLWMASTIAQAGQ